MVQAGFASLNVSTVPAYADLAGLTQPPKQAGALARVSALDTFHWRHIDFCLWTTAPAQDSGHFQRYQVGHLCSLNIYRLTQNYRLTAYLNDRL